VKIKTVLLPLKRQFSIILIILIIFAAAIVLYSTYDYYQLQSGILDDSLASYSAQLAKSTRQSYESYENICYSVAYNQTVQDYLKSSSPSERYSQYQHLQSLLTNMANLNSYIIDIAIYGTDDSFASLNGAAAIYEPFAQDLPDSRFPFQTVGTAVVNQITCHIMAMPVYSLGAGEGRNLGLMFLSVDINSLFDSNLNNETDYDPRIVFTNGSGQLVYGDALIYEGLSGSVYTQDRFLITVPGTEYSVTQYAITGIDHTLYVLIDRSQTTQRVFSIILRLFFCMAALILVLFLFLIILYRPLISSMNHMTKFMKKVAAGDRRSIREGPDIHQGFIGSSEIDDISAAFKDMLTEIDRLNHDVFETYTRMYELEKNKRTTEIAFLRSQINPHFLYNTLTMICGMAAEGNTDKIITVTNALSQIFRYSIKGSDMVPLREEMKIVKSYLTIQEIRFESRFSVRYNFSDDSHDCLIPKMVIQPLVENAIVHGLEKSVQPGTLHIGAGRNPQHGYLAIWIFDTGVGMSPEKLKELREATGKAPLYNTVNDSEDSSNTHTATYDNIGILNVNSRMVLYYGTDYTLLIDSEEGVGTNIQIRIPYHLAEADEGENRSSESS